jgi:hypothetical protein
MTVMDNSIPVHPFEEFPRSDLDIGITRREFLSVMAAELRQFSRQDYGAVAIRIQKFGSLTDDQLSGIIPRILPEAHVHLQEGAVWAKPPNSTRPVRLFPVEPLVNFTFNHFNGKKSLEEIAEALTERSDLPFERAFRFTRGLFLTLVKAGVCLPANDPFHG